MAFASLELDVASDDAELAADALFECGASGLEEQGTRRNKRLIVYAGSAGELEALRLALPAALAGRGIAPQAYRVRVRVDTTDWQHEYLRHLRSVEIAPGYWLKPTHDTSPLPEGAVVLVHEAAPAFGDGSHPTTRLAARALTAYCHGHAGHPGADILDYGCGNGVLSLLAVRAGARSAVGVDIDPVSIEAARKNAELNQLAADVEFVLALERPPRTFGWVIANLEQPALTSVAGELAEHARRTGLTAPVSSLSVTGFLGERAQAVAAAFAAHGLTQLGIQTDGEWALLELAVE